MEIVSARLCFDLTQHRHTFHVFASPATLAQSGSLLLTTLFCLHGYVCLLSYRMLCVRTVYRHEQYPVRVRVEPLRAAEVLERGHKVSPSALLMHCLWGFFCLLPMYRVSTEYVVGSTNRTKSVHNSQLSTVDRESIRHYSLVSFADYRRSSLWVVRM